MSSNRSIFLLIASCAAVIAGGIGFLTGTFRPPAKSTSPPEVAKAPIGPDPETLHPIAPAAVALKPEAKPAAAPVKIETPLTIEKAIESAKKSLASIKAENIDDVAARLPFDKRIQVEGAIERIKKDGPAGLQPNLVITLFENGAPNFVRKTYGSWAIEEKEFKFFADQVWKKCESFRNAKSIESAAIVHGMYWRITGQSAVNYFPIDGEAASIFVNQKSIDYWEAFSGVTWDKLK